MNIEELKLVIQLVSTISGDAKTVVILWFATDIIKYLIGFAGIVIVLKTSVTVLSSFSRPISAIMEINMLLDYPGSYGPVYPADFQKIIDKVRKLKEKDERTNIPQHPSSSSSIKH